MGIVTSGEFCDELRARKEASLEKTPRQLATETGLADIDADTLDRLCDIAYRDGQFLPTVLINFKKEKEAGCTDAEAIETLHNRFPCPDIHIKLKGSKGSKGRTTTKPDSDENPLGRDNLPFITDHLKHYDSVDTLIALQGEEYRPLKKAFWYQIMSMPVRTIKVEEGNLYHDLRFHIAVPLETGGGKKGFTSTMERLFKDTGKYEVVKPTSYHPEQLVGKTVKRGRKDPTYEKLPGHLNEDLLMLDEAIELFRSKQDVHHESRSYLNEALDPYGRNELMKRTTEIPKNKSLSYTPDCNCTVFFQPFSVDEEVLLQGTVRRFIIPYVRFPPQPQSEGYANRVLGVGDMSKQDALDELNPVLDDLSAWADDRDTLGLAPDAIETFIELHQQLVYQGFAHSDKGKNYARIVDYTLQDIFLKMAGIQAAVHQHDTITVEDVQRAYIDLTDLFACTLQYVHDKVIGSLDYGDNWGGAEGEDQECLHWLKEQGATTKEESAVSIQDYVEEIADRCDIGEEAAKKRHYKHKENNWVKSKQVGKHDSRVWLDIEQEDKPVSVSMAREFMLDPTHYQTLVDRFRDENT